MRAKSLKNEIADIIVSQSLVESTKTGNLITCKTYRQ